MILSDEGGMPGIKNVGNWHRVNTDKIVAFQGRVFGQDHLDVIKMMHYKTRASTESLFWNYFRLLTFHPMLCGLISQMHLMTLQAHAINTNSSQGILTSAANLYSAAHHMQVMPPEMAWDDMDFFLELQSNGEIFVGERPKGLKDFIHHFEPGLKAENKSRNTSGKSSIYRSLKPLGHCEDSASDSPQNMYKFASRRRRRLTLPQATSSS